MILLIRHGQTHLNAERRFMGVTDAPLNDVGLQQAARLGQALKGRVHAVIASPLARAQQTAQAIGPVQTDGDLAELNQGSLEGLTGAEAIARFPDFFARWQQDPTHATVPGGESLHACQQRAVRAVERAVARHQSGETVALVTHQMVISSLRCWLDDTTLHGWRERSVRNTSVSLVRRQDALALGVCDVLVGESAWSDVDRALSMTLR